MGKAVNKAKKDSFFGLHFTSIVSISLVLFMVGIISMIISSARIMTMDAKENIAMSIVLEDSIQTEDLERLNNYLASSYFTKETVYISKEDALKEHTASIGEDPSEFLGYNPLNASLEVYLKSEYTSVDSIVNVIEPKLSDFVGIKNIAYQESMINILNNNLQKASVLIAIVALVLLIISIVLINNTIRLTIYSKRFIINTMLLVGAKKSYIRWPFLKRALLNGCLSAMLALFVLGVSTYYIQAEIGTSFLLYHIDIVVPTVLMVLVLGIIITFFASMFSVNRYVNMKTNKLYFV